MQLIDSHCHLNFDGLAGRLSEVFANMAANQVSHALAVSVSRQSFDQVLAIAEQHAHIYASVGIKYWMKNATILMPPCPPAVSTTSGRSKSTCCGRKRKTATRPPPSGFGNITASLRNKRPRINGRPIIGMPKPAGAVSRSRFGGNAGQWLRRWIGRVVGRYGCGVLA